MWKGFFASAAVLALVVGSFAGAAAQTGVSAADRAFILKAADGGVTEVELGRLAASGATSGAVRQFGQRMVTDHGAANAQLQALAASKGVALQSTPGPEHRTTLDRLSTERGDFDRAYMQEMVKDHDKDVAEFQRASQTIQDPNLRAWVNQTLPTLLAHQRMAREISGLLAQGVSPSALPAAVGVTRRVAPWCQGAWDVVQGSNFGECRRQ